MRNDPEFSFYGKKFDDSKDGALEDDDTAPATTTTTTAVNVSPKNEDAMDVATDGQVTPYFFLCLNRKTELTTFFPGAHLAL